MFCYMINQSMKCLRLIISCTFRYSKLDSLVDQIFPPTMPSDVVDELSIDYSAFNYWKTPFPDMVDTMSLSDDDNIGL